MMQNPLQLYQNVTQQHLHVKKSDKLQSKLPTTHHNHFTALSLGPPGSASARRELLGFMVQGECKGRLTEADTLTIWLGATPF